VHLELTDGTKSCGNKKFLLHTRFWHIRIDDFRKHARCNNLGWFWHSLLWKVEVTCLFRNGAPSWLWIFFGIVAQQINPVIINPVGNDDVITSVPSKELLAFLDSYSFLSLSQAWLQFQIIFNNGSKWITQHIELFGHFTLKNCFAKNYP
jgi:hypothetical protein